MFSLFQFKAHCKWNAGVEDVVDHRIFERAVGVVGTSFTAAVDLAREASLRRDDFVFGLIVRIETVRSVIVVIVAFVHSTTDRSYGRYAVTLSTINTEKRSIRILTEHQRILKNLKES